MKVYHHTKGGMGSGDDFIEDNGYDVDCGLWVKAEDVLELLQTVLESMPRYMDGYWTMPHSSRQLLVDVAVDLAGPDYHL